MNFFRLFFFFEWKIIFRVFISGYFPLSLCSQCQRLIISRYSKLFDTMSLMSFHIFYVSFGTSNTLFFSHNVTLLLQNSASSASKIIRRKYRNKSQAPTYKIILRAYLYANVMIIFKINDKFGIILIY